MRFTHERLHGGASSEAPLLHVFHVDTLQEFSYNEHGGVVRSVLRHADAQTPQIVSGTAYQHNGNHILSQTDARGKTVTHDIDENTDLTRAVTDPNGQQVQYAYDSARRVTQVSASAGGKQYKNAYAYENDRLKTVSHNTDDSAANDVTYRFAYDAVGRPTETHVGSRLLSRNVYNADGTLQKVTYGNSSAASAQEVMYGYDDFRRLKDVRFGGDTAPRYEYAYNARGGVAWVRNNRLNTIARSDYDFGGRPRSMVTQDASGANVYTARVDYDTCGRLARFAEQVGASRAAYETTFGYDREDRPTALTYGSSASRTENAYDGLGRLSTRKVYVNGSAYTTAYAYASGAESGQTTALVQEITQPGENHSYAYDNVGNIVSAARNGVTITYAYDALGQLIRVNDPNDGTWTYEYDCGGNILNKKQYAYTTGTLGTVQQIVSYAYGDADWKDKLTRFNGVDIAYDAIGNPIQDGVWTYTWENGRQLRRMACDATIAEFVYNADGLRVQKTVNGVATNYTLHGKNIVHMTKGNAELHFWYDAQNRPAIVEFNGTKYGYLYNLQGDVIGLIDSANTEVVRYTYDAWGKLLSVTGSLANTIGYYNPFRYRGYVYDVETGLYYLRSRYYNPSWGRFVNADVLIRGNLYTYCDNLPVVYSDPNGMMPSAKISKYELSVYDDLAGGGGGGLIIAWSLVGIANTLSEFFGNLLKPKTLPVAKPKFVQRTETRILADVEADNSKEGVYFPAYIDVMTNYVMCDYANAMSYDEAMEYCSSAKLLATHFGVGQKRVGIYTYSQAAAKALAYPLGATETKNPEVHGINYVGHYHSVSHGIHIWYGFPIP